MNDEVRGQYLLSKANLSGAERTELQSLSPEAHKAFRAELRDAIALLRNLLAVGDPLHISALVQLTNLFGGWGTYYEPTHEGSEAKVELVVGLLATQPPPDDLHLVEYADTKLIYEELDHLLQVQLLYNLSMPRGDDQDAATLRLMGTMNWLMLRGSSFGNHGQDLARSVYGPHDEWMLAKYGFTVGDVIALGDAATSLMNERANDLMSEAKRFADEVLHQLGSKELKGRIDAEDEKELSTKEGRSQMYALALADTIQSGVRQALTFSVDEICDANTALRPDRTEAVLRELSVTVGSLDPSAYTGLYDKSPFVERPFLEFNGRFLLAVPGMVLRDPVALLERRLLTGKKTFSQARAKVLDQLAVRYLSGMLPGSVAYTNLVYEEFELDGLVLFEDVALVVEGKGTALSVPARRGDLARLRSDIGEAAEEAWKQGVRDREFLLSEGDTVFRDERGAEVRIPAGSVREVIIVNPTLHELGGHAPQLARLRSLGLFPDEELPWSVYINDLRVIAETCGNAAIFLHYLTWRNRLPLGDQVTVSDEIDLWASYLLCERFGMLAEHGKTIVGNASTDFDAYYDGLAGRGPKREPPTKYLHEPVTSFVERMASKRPPGWRGAAGACLDLSLAELALISGRAHDLARRATNEGRVLWMIAGRVALVCMPREADVAEVLDQESEGDPTLVIYCQEAASQRAEIVWAKCVKPVTFELSDFEKAASEAASVKQGLERVIQP
jgi:hypothetical protein